MLDPSHPRAVTDLVSRLVDALSGRGLLAEPFGANMVRVINRAADPPGHARTRPSLRQTVICRRDDDGHLSWWWLWSGPGADPDYEWLCPGLEISIAVNAITRVLALRPATDEEPAGT